MNTYTAKKAIRTAYWKALDASETLDHMDSVVSRKIIAPIREAIERRTPKVDHYAF